MKRHYLSFVCAMMMAFVLPAFNSVFAQDNADMKVTMPFDQLPVSNIKAAGNFKTGSVEISMDFENKYDKTANVSLSLGGFSDLGITTDKGKKYKIYTSENLIGTADINKGYARVSAVQFGDKKFDWVTMVQQDLPQGEKRKLTVRIDKFDKAAKVITDFHIRCILSLNYFHTGDNLYRIENLPIEWK